MTIVRVQGDVFPKEGLALLLEQVVEGRSAVSLREFIRLLDASSLSSLERASFWFRPFKAAPELREPIWVRFGPIASVEQLIVIMARFEAFRARAWRVLLAKKAMLLPEDLIRLMMAVPSYRMAVFRVFRTSRYEMGHLAWVKHLFPFDLGRMVDKLMKTCPPPHEPRIAGLLLQRFKTFPHEREEIWRSLGPIASVEQLIFIMKIEPMFRRRCWRMLMWRKRFLVPEDLMRVMQAAPELRTAAFQILARDGSFEKENLRKLSRCFPILARAAKARLDENRPETVSRSLLRRVA